MIRYVNFVLLMGISMVFMGCMGTAITPSIGDRYSDQQIDSMVSLYKSGPDHEVRPPEAVQRAFMRDYPGAYDVEFEMSQNIYKAEFELSRRDYKAYYDAEGNLIMHQYEVCKSELPPVVKNAVKQRYPHFSIDEVSRFIKGTRVGYKVHIERMLIDAEYNLWYWEDGILIDEWWD